MEIQGDATARTVLPMMPAAHAEALPPEPQPQVIDVLVLDDSRFDAMFIQRECRRTELPVRVSIAPDMDRFRVMLAERSYHLVFIDYLLPDGDGLQAHKMMQQGGRNGEAPVVMISGEARHDVAVEAMKEGCIDYKAKSDLTPEALRALILRALEVGAQVNRAHLSAALDVQRQEIVSAMRDVLREELGMAQGDARGSVRKTLQDYGMIPEDSETDWEEVFGGPDTNLIFHTH